MSVKLPDVTAFDWTSKKISSSVLDLYGVGMDSTGRVVSPHYSPDMELLAYHVRTPGQRDFRMHGSNVPLGLHTLGNNKELIICEGHTDTYSAKTMFPRCDVIGLPGSDTVKSLTPYLSRIRKYKRITIMVDADAAGRKCRDALIELLPKSKTYTTQLADGSDISDYLANDNVDDLQQRYKLSTANKVSNFVDDSDCEKYATSTAYDVISTGIPGLDDMLGGGLSVADLTLITGYTGTGKSALAQQMAVNIAKSGIKVLYVAGEMTPKQNLDRLTRQWYGVEVLKRSELVDKYKAVKDTILISKLSDLTLANVTDVMHEAVLDHGVRVIIIDVLSDIDGFISTDMTNPTRIIKAMKKVAQGDDMDEVTPCAVLCVAHTKGSDDGNVRGDSIRGGSTIRQEASGGIFAIQEEQQGDMSNTRRTITMVKRPRNRDHECNQVTLQYDTINQRYTEVGQDDQAQDSSQESVRFTARRTVPQDLPTPRVPLVSEVPVGNIAQDETIRSTDEHRDTSTVTSAISISESVPTGLLRPTDEPVHRDEGDTTHARQDEVSAGGEDAPDHTVQVSGTVDTSTEHAGTSSATTVTQPSGTPVKLNSIQRMYQRYPDVLREHQTNKYKSNHIIRANLTALGYELL